MIIKSVSTQPHVLKQVPIYISCAGEFYTERQKGS